MTIRTRFEKLTRYTPDPQRNLCVSHRGHWLDRCDVLALAAEIDRDMRVDLPKLVDELVSLRAEVASLKTSKVGQP